MKPARKRINKVAYYKGYKIVQHPWSSYDGMQYARYVYDPDGKNCMHSGYGSCCNQKELKLILMEFVDFYENKLEKILNDNKNEEDI